MNPLTMVPLALALAIIAYFAKPVWVDVSWMVRRWWISRRILKELEAIGQMDAGPLRDARFEQWAARVAETTNRLLERKP